MCVLYLENNNKNERKTECKTKIQRGKKNTLKDPRTERKKERKKIYGSSILHVYVNFISNFITRMCSFTSKGKIGI